MMFRYLLIAVILFSFIACGVPKRVIKDFTYCFDHKVTGIDSLMNIKGFYYLINKEQPHKIDPKETPLKAFIFYANGFAMTKHPTAWLKTNMDDKYSFFGIANLVGDTIKVQFLGSPRGMSVDKYEVWFKILDRRTLKMIYQGDGKYLTNKDIEQFNLNTFYQKYGTIYKFYPLKRVPRISKTYIINKRWFWCNEKDYKAWKKK